MSLQHMTVFCRAQHTLLDLQEEGVDGLPVPMQKSNWAIPKINLMRYWVQTIRAFGSANVTSTGFGERSHVPLKDSLRFTNRHSAEKIDEQVLVAYYVVKGFIGGYTS